MPGESMKGKIVLVTGGAGGVGRGICECAAAAGAQVILTGNRPESDLRKFATTLPGKDHLARRVPLTDSLAIAEFAEEMRGRFGRLDVLVNNAGTTRLVPLNDLEGLDDALIDDIFQVNWRGAFAMVRAFRTLLEVAGDALIVNISSNAALTGVGSNIAYCASKAAIDSMTRSLARVLAPKVRVLSLAPGFVDTGFVTDDPAWRARAAKQSLFEGAIDPKDVGQAVIALATSFPKTTGVFIPVDGGRL